MKQHYDLSDQEKIVGNTFENFVRHCNGNKAVASLYFGKAYWNARGVKKYDAAYDFKIDKLEKKKNPKAKDLAPF